MLAACISSSSSRLPEDPRNNAQVRSLSEVRNRHDTPYSPCFYRDPQRPPERPHPYSKSRVKTEEPEHAIKREDWATAVKAEQNPERFTVKSEDSTRVSIKGEDSKQIVKLEPEIASAKLKSGSLPPASNMSLASGSVAAAVPALPHTHYIQAPAGNSNGKFIYATKAMKHFAARPSSYPLFVDTYLHTPL